MELSFLAAALRRRWWVVALALLVGLVAASTIDEDDATSYRADAELLVLPGNPTAPGLSGQPDRFVASELAVMGSMDLAEIVAADLTTADLDARRVRAVTEFRQQPDTNIVTVEATTADPDVSVEIANTYARAYLQAAERRSGQETTDVLGDLDDQLDEVRDDLAAVNAQLREVVTPYIASLTTDDPLPVPPLAVIAPELTTQRDLLLTSYGDILSYRQTLELEALEAGGGSLIDSATRATASEPESAALLQAVVVLGALLVGLGLAPLTLQLSDRVADGTLAERLIGARVVGHLPRSRHLAASPSGALTRAGRTGGGDDVVQRLWAQVEWGVTASEGLPVVAVGGTTRRAGTTTVALLVARQAVENGRQVVVIDADTVRPWLSERYPAPDGQLAATERDGVRVLPGAEALRRGVSVDQLIASVEGACDLVVVDVGRLLATSGALAVCQQAAGVVVAIPLGRASERDVSDTAAALSGRIGAEAASSVLPVTTRPSMRSGLSGRRVPTRSSDRPGGQDGVVAARARSLATDTDTDTTDADDDPSASPTGARASRS